MSQNLKAASAEVGGQPRELSPAEAYNLAEEQKEKAAQDFRRQIVGIYQAVKAGNVTAETGNHFDPAAKAKQGTALAEFIAAVDQKLASKNLSAADLGDVENKTLNLAVRSAYREIAVKHGLKRIDPNSPNFERDLDEFYANYLTNFPVAEEQESKEGFRALLSAPPRADGYCEVAYSVVCPLTGRYLMGSDFTIQQESNSIHFIYGFVMPWARRAIGFSKPLLDIMHKASAGDFAAHQSAYPGAPIVTFEKNILGAMTLTDILMDTAGVDIHNPPREGADLHKSSIGQSLRDLVWDRMGARIVPFNYIQSSLDGVVKIENPADEKLAIRYLNKDSSLTTEDKQRAEEILEQARGDKVEGCTVLNLCVFVPPDAKEVSVEQIRHAMKVFQGTSVVKDPENVEQDVYFKAMMSDLESRAQNGMIPLERIKPFGGQVEVKSFEDAEMLTKLLLKNVTWEELRANADRPYEEWLQEKMEAVAPAFVEYKTGQAARQNAIPASGAPKPGQ